LSALLAAEFYVDPQNGSAANDGSAAKPWKTLEEVISQNLVETQGWQTLPWVEGAPLVVKNAGAPIKAGDTIWLRSGYHGRVVITGWYNAAPITIAAEAGHTPQLASISIRAGKNWKLSGLELSPELAPVYEVQTPSISESRLQPIRDRGRKLPPVLRADVSAWTATDWEGVRQRSISRTGADHNPRQPTKNVNFGIGVLPRITYRAHTIDSFAGDGLRGLGDDTTFQST
jgi:hypothetical protein